MSGQYDDIIHLSRPVSATRARMSAWDRAAQFSPYAALTGYEAAILETGRLTDHREECSDNRSAELDRVLHEIVEVLDSCPKIRIVLFVPDDTKAGGAYVTKICRVRKVDLYRRELWTVAGERIPMDDIWELEPVIDP